MWFVFESAELVNQVGCVSRKGARGICLWFVRYGLFLSAQRMGNQFWFLAKAQGELLMVCVIWIVFKRAKAGKPDMFSR